MDLDAEVIRFRAFINRFTPLLEELETEFEAHKARAAERAASDAEHAAQDGKPEDGKPEDDANQQSEQGEHDGDDIRRDEAGEGASADS